MIETPDTEYTFLCDGKSVPLFSLYSQTREPTPEQIHLVDTLIVDLLDIGTRIYTYMYTLAACLRAANRHGKRVVVLDRPNPLGLAYKDLKAQRWTRVLIPLSRVLSSRPDRTLQVEGNLLDAKAFLSFVGWYPIPIRHGLTLGELGHLFVAHEAMRTVNYSVIKAEGLKRSFGSVRNLGTLFVFSASLSSLARSDRRSWPPISRSGGLCRLRTCLLGIRRCSSSRSS